MSRHAAHRGWLDGVTPSGFVEGWAYDSEDPTGALAVSVMHDGCEVAWGLAHHFREDLMNAGCATGWCAFRLKLAVPVKQVTTGVTRLLERSSFVELHRVDGLALREVPEAPLSTVEEVVASDPTLLGAIGQLRGCDSLLLAYIRRHGVESFVRAAYNYVLGRPADDAGRVQYARAIRQATLTPFQILTALADSDEFRSRPRQLGAPHAASFPFG